MNKFSAFSAIVLLAICSYAQPPASTDASAAATRIHRRTAADDKKVPRLRRRGIAIPPEKAEPVTVPKMALAMTIDGKLDEEVWKTAAVFKDFYQTSPGDNIAPSKPTEVLMMYDEKHLYVAFKCWDEKDKIRATRRETRQRLRRRQRPDVARHVQRSASGLRARLQSVRDPAGRHLHRRSAAPTFRSTSSWSRKA